MSLDVTKIRVPMTIDDPIGDLPGDPELPPRLMVIKHMTGSKTSNPNSKPIAVNKQNIDLLPAMLGPSLSFDVADRISGDPDSRLAVNLTFTKGPKQFVAQTIQQVEVLRLLDQKRRALVALKTRVRNDPALARRLKSFLKGDLADLETLLAEAAD